MSVNNHGVRWDLLSFFPEFNGPKMLEFKKKLEADIASLQTKAAAMAPLSADTASQWEAVILLMEDLQTKIDHIFSYIGCLTASDAKNEAYAQEEASLYCLAAEYEKFDVDLLRAFKNIPDDFFNSFIARPALAGAENLLRRTREEAAHTMSPVEEKLTAELNVDGFHAWGRIYDKVTGKLEFDMVYPDGRVVRTPISQWRSLMSDNDREIGKAAFECGNKAWAGIEDMCAATLNSIAGTRLTLNKHRGIDDFLYKALFQSSIQKSTLDAMYKAIYDNIEISRDILRAKAKFLGRDGIHWFEREAPLPLKDVEDKKYSWDEGSGMVNKAFDTAYPALGQYYRTFMENRWMESERRPGKRPGAFCTGSTLTNEQRVFMTYNGTLSDTTTIAHELGHAFHGFVLNPMRTLAKHYPMTLAETASIFAELIFAEGVYADESIGDDQKLQMLDADLCGAAVLLLDITVRFEFEKAFYTERAAGEVTVSRLKELMVETQRRVFGDSLIPESADPLFWASKLHFYITHVTFYNFPYTFGFLFARALTALFMKDGQAFLPRYEEFLRLTGSDTVENVARRSIGVDVGDPAFWAESITSLAGSLEIYTGLLAKRSGHKEYPKVGGMPCPIG